MASLAFADLLALRGDAGMVFELRARARAVATLDDPMVAGMILQSEAGHLSVLGRHVEARAEIEQLVSAARAAGAAGVLVYPLGLLGEIELRSGNWRRAIAVASEAVELAEQTGQLAWGTFAMQVLTRVEAARGHFETAAAHAARAQAVADAFAFDGMRFYLPSARAFLALTAGDLEEAVDEAREVEEISRERGLLEPAVVLWAPDLIESYARLDRRREAQRVLERFTSEAVATQRAWALAAAARCRGILEDDFEGAFAEALERHAGLGMPFERARTELCLGERRRRTGRRTDARGPLRSALRAFERLGARPWAERARSELAASGERVRPRAAARTDELTPHELRVALVVARGATNREAAAELFVSPKTVDFHLRQIYRKLGIRSRAELGRLFASEAAF
jgi:DNA-binding CsgD family transcriptional regulator